MEKNVAKKNESCVSNFNSKKEGLWDFIVEKECPKVGNRRHSP